MLAGREYGTCFSKASASKNFPQKWTLWEVLGWALARATRDEQIFTISGWTEEIWVYIGNIKFNLTEIIQRTFYTIHELFFLLFSVFLFFFVFL